MIDPVYEDAVQQLKEFNGKKLMSTTKVGLDIEDDEVQKLLEELIASAHQRQCTGQSPCLAPMDMDCEQRCHVWLWIQRSQCLQHAFSPSRQLLLEGLLQPDGHQ